MDEKQLKPVEESLKPIEEEPKKTQPTKKEPTKIISKLPEWSIEPPIKINRGK